VLRTHAAALRRDERGAALVFTALSLPAVVALGALAVGVTTLWTSRQDLQRSADLAALAAAASTPTLSSELPLDGLELFQDLDLPLDPADWRQRACAVAQAQLGDGNAVVSEVFSDGDAPTCTPRWSFESPLLAVLDGCGRDVAELAGCSAAMDGELRASLPLVDSLDAATQSAAAEVHAMLDPADKLVDSALATQLGDACANEVDVGLLGVTAWTCTHRVRDVFGAVDHRTGAVVGTLDSILAGLVGRVQQAVIENRLNPLLHGLGLDPAARPKVGFDLAGFAPAAVTPRVQLELGDLDVHPLLSPATFEMGSTATARRVIKSALVLPSLGVPGVDAWSELPTWTQNRLTSLLGPDAAGRLERAGRDGWVLDPNVLNQQVPHVATRVFTLLDRLEGRVSTSVSSSLCASLPATVGCPVGDDVVDRDHLLGPFMEDVWDATRPPPSGTAPTVQDVLGAYADAGEPLHFVTGLRPFLIETLLPEGVVGTLRNPHLEPNLSGLIAPLMFVPALDVVPATVLRDGDGFRIEPVLATTGLFKGRLVA
jgi:hypothetical protein